ncbi:hypothetical protein RJ640_017411 [Escallonia rubra]|uniref:Uncharacterized protein n=1 Tax=Escallonia rubra TaxID=112253 RepID=A0AA88QUM4_9ASTE|nr:hypothetical protein RJ640_017411 [Escallonia rubra]
MVVWRSVATAMYASPELAPVLGLVFLAYCDRFWGRVSKLNSKISPKIRRSTILMPSMPFQLNSFSTAAKRFPFLLISFLLILYHAPNLAADARRINIGAILDVGSRAGKEQKAALTVAVRNFNSNSEKHKL